MVKRYVEEMTDLLCGEKTSVSVTRVMTSFFPVSNCIRRRFHNRRHTEEELLALKQEITNFRNVRGRFFIPYQASGVATPK